MGYGIFDSNNMGMVCEFVCEKEGGSGYGVMNMIGVCGGGLISEVLGGWGDRGNLGGGFGMVGMVVGIGVGVELYLLGGKSENME